MPASEPLGGHPAAREECPGPPGGAGTALRPSGFRRDGRPSGHGQWGAAVGDLGLVWFGPEQGGEHDADIGTYDHRGRNLQTGHRSNLCLP